MNTLQSLDSHGPISIGRYSLREYLNRWNYIVFRQILYNHILTCTNEPAKVFCVCARASTSFKMECCLSASFGKVSHMKMRIFITSQNKNKIQNTHSTPFLCSHKNASILFFFVQFYFILLIVLRPPIKQFENI